MNSEVNETMSDKIESKSENSATIKGDVANIMRGVLMGGADIIPGVSGGTVALILGIYQRLVRAIGRVDGTFVKLLFNGYWISAANHIDLRFLVCLGIGILTGVVSLASTVHTLLEDHRQLTFAAFFGLIAASGILVARMVERWNPLDYVTLIASAIAAYLLVGLPLLEDPPDGLWYLFLCGYIAICAMILPGISGAFLLVILGKYIEITGIIKGFKDLEFGVTELTKVAVFASGCLLGLLSFARLLKWLLQRHEKQTMVVLCGLMLGAMRSVWPFQRLPEAAQGPDVNEKVRATQWENVSITSIDFATELIPAVVVAVLAMGFVFLLDYLSNARGKVSHVEFEEE